jgi:hypothetical protein
LLEVAIAPRRRTMTPPPADLASYLRIEERKLEADGLN